MDQVFLEMSELPVAAASLGQVRRAWAWAGVCVRVGGGGCVGMCAPRDHKEC